MSHRFKARTAEDEAAIRDMVGRTIEKLREIDTGPDRSRMGFESRSAIILADLLDIGCAPGGTPLSSELRTRASRYETVRVDLGPGLASDLAHRLEIGLIRHESGIDDAATFRLH